MSPKTPVPFRDRLGASIREAAIHFGYSEWVVKDDLRAGRYKARKRGRKTIVDVPSALEYYEGLPAATFAPPVERRAATPLGPEARKAISAKASAAKTAKALARRAAAEAAAAAPAAPKRGRPRKIVAESAMAEAE
jgi:transposase